VYQFSVAVPDLIANSSGGASSGKTADDVVAAFR
jgi:hypothetical protein